MDDCTVLPLGELKNDSLRSYPTVMPYVPRCSFSGLIRNTGTSFVSSFFNSPRGSQVQASQVKMTNTTEQMGAPNNRPSADVTVVLIQHWANRVQEVEARITDLRESYAHALRINNTLESRNADLYMDNLDLHRQCTEQVVQLAEQAAMSFRLQDMVINMVRENPELRERYRDEFWASVVGYTPGNPIDLTTDEELDEDL